LQFFNVIQHKIDEIHLSREWIFCCFRSFRIIPVLLECILTVLWHLPGRHLPEDICAEDICPEDIRAEDICPDGICPVAKRARKSRTTKKPKPDKTDEEFLSRHLTPYKKTLYVFGVHEIEFESVKMGLIQFWKSDGTKKKRSVQQYRW
jgi:hypothetical protein